jgi:hypothetical protein
MSGPALRKVGLASLLAMGTALVVSSAARAHCDTTHGPVVVDAQRALELGEVTPVLKWVGPADEDEVRAAFEHARRVRALGPDARALADRFFFETLVRVHRADEGAPYTGLRDEASEPIIRAVDSALATGQAEPLVEQMVAAVASSVRASYQRALAARPHADHDVEHGREYVAAYVEFTHLVERIQAATAVPARSEPPGVHAPHGGHVHP